MSQGEIHVVAAEQQVVADGETLQTQFSVNLVDRDQRQVGRPASDVNDQQHVAGRQHLAPIVGVRGQPAVNGRLRLFQQHEVVGQSSFDRRLAGQLPGRRVKRGGNGQHHLLVAQRSIGMSRVPSGGQVRRGIAACNRKPRPWSPPAAIATAAPLRYARHVRDKANSWPPRRRVADSPPIAAARSAQQSRHRIIDQRCFQRFDFAFARQIQERWKRDPRFDLPRPDQLGNRQQLQ